MARKRKCALCGDVHPEKNGAMFHWTKLDGTPEKRQWVCYGCVPQGSRDEEEKEAPRGREDMPETKRIRHGKMYKNSAPR